MSAAVLTVSEDLALQIYLALKEIDPARIASAQLDSIRAKLLELSQQSYAIPEQWKDRERLISEQLDRLMSALRAVPETADLDPSHWEEFRKSAQLQYEKFAQCLRGANVRVPSLRPTNYVRNFFHACGATTSLTVLLLTPEGAKYVASAFLIWAIAMETLRRSSPKLNTFLVRLFARVMHPHEEIRVNSGTWYIGALVILAWFMPTWAAAAALMVLGLGDPLAAIVGRRFGRIQIRRNRTLEGTLSLFVAGALGAYAILFWAFPELPLDVRLWACGLAALGGAVADVLLTSIDDNFTIPVFAALFAAFAPWI